MNSVTSSAADPVTTNTFLPPVDAVTSSIMPASRLGLCNRLDQSFQSAHCTAMARGVTDPSGPSQWLEEAIVESFSLHGLGRLAHNWQHNPPFAADNAYREAISDYRQNIVQRYGRLAAEQGASGDVGAWFRRHREEIEAPSGLHRFAQAASLIVLAEYERTPSRTEAVGALNRWPGRTGMPIEEYLHTWEASCVELQASPVLPVALREALRIA